jgi:hypothetical protein
VENNIDELTEKLDDLKLLAQSQATQSDNTGNCRPPRICYKCEQEGHLSRDCPRKTNTTALIDVNDAEAEEAALWAARYASKQQQLQEDTEEHVHVASMESLTTQVAPVDTYRTAALLEDLVAAFKRHTPDGEQEGPSRPQKRTPYPLELPRCNQDTPMSEAPPPNPAPTGPTSATRYRAAHSSPSSRTTASTGPYNIIGQLGATTAKIDFRTLLDISPKIRHVEATYV